LVDFNGQKPDENIGVVYQSCFEGKRIITATSDEAGRVVTGEKYNQNVGYKDGKKRKIPDDKIFNLGFFKLIKYQNFNEEKKEG
jgi:hypothetical protein